MKLQPFGRNQISIGMPFDHANSVGTTGFLKNMLKKVNSIHQTLSRLVALD
jgi:MFS family permease